MDESRLLGSTRDWAPKGFGRRGCYLRSRETGSEVKGHTSGYRRGPEPTRGWAAQLGFGYVGGEPQVGAVISGLRLGSGEAGSAARKEREGLMRTPEGAEPESPCREQGEGTGLRSEREFI